MLEHEYRLDFFQRNHFERHICKSCSTPFWTQDKAREQCGDPPCASYEFIGKPITRKKYTLGEMREAFLKFMEERGHKRVARFPVVARWRDDIYLTIASIADFQPHVTSGVVPPPANPLCISQPCIRLNDLDSVGRSGRHLTCFEMMAHHVFNTPEKEIYWKDRTVELCHEFLTKALGVDGKAVTYKENPWAGGGNAGPAVEVLVGGLEVATLVFMNMKADPQGSIELKGEKYSLMPMRIVDTGYGLERLAWASNGAANIYEALWPELLKQLKAKANLQHTLDDPRLQRIMTETVKLSGVMSVDTNTKLLALREEVARRLAEKGIQVTAQELEKDLKPLESLYALADHSRTLAFMLGDGIVPSNVKGGYLARLIIRRTLRLVEELGMAITLPELLDMQLQALGRDFPELRANKETMMKIAELEAERYRETLEKGTRLVQQEAKRIGQGGSISIDMLIGLYDSNGLSPEIVKQVAEKQDVKVEIPDDFYTRVAALHSSEKRTAKAQAEVPKEWKALPKTKLMYYDSQGTKEFDAVVLWAKDKQAILDQCAFFAEAGGQPPDQGTLSSKDGDLVEVKDVQAHDGLVVLTFEGGKLKRGQVVHGRVDWGRRMANTRAHTATHVTLASARRVLGNHVWQTGAQKGDISRIDITHFRRISDEELRQIEQLANLVVLEDMAVERLWLDRDEAEKKWGVQLYQGGIPPGKVVRVVKIADYDVECCGGTHVRHTSEIGPIKLVRTDAIQDGVHRIEFSAGMAAVRRFQERDVLLAKASEVLGTRPDQLPQAAEKFFNEWKALRKQVEELSELAAAGRKGKLLEQAESVGKGRLVVSQEQATMDQLLALAGELVKEPGVVAVLGSAKEGSTRIVVARSKDLSVNAGEVVREASKAAGGGGGGKPELAQGGGPDASRLGDALKVAAEEARKRLA